MEKEYVGKHTVYSAVVGSKAYGTDTLESDTDVRGIAVLPDLSHYFGYLKKFEQFEDKANDVVIYDVRKALKLIADCNPNMVDLLFVEDRFIQSIHPCFHKVIENRESFLSLRAVYSYTGYAFSQLSRIKTARGWLLNPPKKKPERSDFGLEKQRELSKSQQGAFQWVFANILKDTIDFLGFSEETKEELRSANYIGAVQKNGIPDVAFDEVKKITGASDAWMEIMKREQAYSNAKREYDSYVSWKQSRNKKRAELEEKFGYDTKHAMHLVRLIRMGEEIVSTGRVNVWRPDREELLAIRNGAWKYEEIEEFAKDMQEKIRELAKTSRLPKKPNHSFLDNICIGVIQDYIKEC